MRIVYLANHTAGGADDEGAITHALTALGHDVQRVREVRASAAHKVEADFCLIHHFRDSAILKRIRCPKVFWSFDLIEYPDPTLEARNRARRAWMAEVIPHVQLGFLTDGDFVDRDTSGKLLWLPQGADERVAGAGTAKGDGPDILFTGIKRGGQRRESFVEEMRGVYGSRFHHIEKGVYGRELADLIAGAKIVVAPDGPVTTRYWSNRVYVALGFGAFLLHPFCERLAEQYSQGCEIVFYRDREELHRQIAYYLKHPNVREAVARQGYRHTISQHTYRHRCAYLIGAVKERLL